MKICFLPLLLLPLTAAHADTFGSGANTFDMDFTTIGNPGNAADSTGYGSVGYTYRIGTYEVSQGMISIYNALSGGPLLTTQSLTSYGGNGPDKPATGISWNEAARFVNWLNTSKGYSEAYKFTTAGRNDNIALWTNGDSGYDPANPFRNSNAYYFLPSEDEWYKAAYYDPNKSGGAGYWDYATGSDSVPTAVTGGTSSGTAVFGQTQGTGPAIITNAGGLSPYGTMAQNGNVGEWQESGFTAPNDSATEPRVIRGGSWTSGASGTGLVPTNRGNPASPPPTTGEYANNGFRVASVAIPEPSACLLTLLGAFGLVLRRKR